jgi:hypothetical protein
MDRKDTKTTQGRGGKYTVPIFTALFLSLALFMYIVMKFELWQMFI